MKLPTMPAGWWIAYIYPLASTNEWEVDARSMTARVTFVDQDLEQAIEGVKLAISLGNVDVIHAEPKPPKKNGLLDALGLVAPPPKINRRSIR